MAPSTSMSLLTRQSSCLPKQPRPLREKVSSCVSRTLSSNSRRCVAASLQAGEGGANSQAALRAGLERLFAKADVHDAPLLPMPSPGMQTNWPSVDWSRYNLQLLFVDKTGIVRSRFAALIFERIAEWNGWSRAIIPASCGLHTQQQPGAEASLSKMAAIFTAGSSLGLGMRSLAKPAENFDMDLDLDFYDLVLVLDRGLHEDLLAQIPAEHLEYYKKKVCLLTCFSDYESEGTMLAKGGLALLPSKLSWILRQSFSQTREVVDVPSPDFSSATSEEECSSMLQALILACGGLCKYLMDSFPENMPDYDPVD